MAHIVSTGAVTNGTATSLTTTAVDTTGANLIVLTFSTFGTSNTVTITDNQSNTYSVGGANVDGLDVDSSVTVYYVSVPTVGASHTFTCSVITADYIAIAVSAFSGMETSGVLDQVLRTAESGVVTSHTTGNTAALAQADEVVIGSLSIGSTSTLTIGSGYTDAYTVASDADSQGISQEYKTVSSTSAVAATWTTGTSNRLPVICTTWKMGTGTVALVGAALAANPGTHTSDRAIGL